MDDRTCDAVAGDLAQVAAGVLEVPECDGLGDHLRTCDACRERLRVWSRTADDLTLLATAVEPPPNFESRVLERIGVAAAAVDHPSAIRHHPRRRLAVTVAAVAATVALVVAGTLVWGRDDPPSSPSSLAAAGGRAIRSADLLDTGGRSVGSVVELAGDRATYVVSVDHPRAGRRYSCVLVDAAGAQHRIGEWSSDGERQSWTVEATIPMTTHVRTRAMRLLTPDGSLWATATF